MSANVELNITAFDNSSTVFSSVGSAVQECFATVQIGATEAVEPAETSTSEMIAVEQIFHLICGCNNVVTHVEIFANQFVP